MAEVPASKLVEAHGTFSTASCIRCHKSYDGEQIKVSLHERKVMLIFALVCLRLGFICWFNRVMYSIAFTNK